VNPIEVETLGLWNKDKIEKFKKLYEPTEIIGVIADLHIGSITSLTLPEYTKFDGSKIVANEKGKAIYECWKNFVELINTWNPQTIYGLGDFVSATSTKLFKDFDIIPDIDNQKEMCIQLLEPLTKDRTFKLIAGTPFHDSIDTRVHYDIAKRLNGIPYVEGYIYDVKDEVPIMMSHQTRAGALYPLGVMERETLFTQAGIKRGKIEDVKLLIGGHWHQYHEVYNGIVDIIIPCWQGYYAYKGKTVYYGIRQPDIGGLIVLIKKDKFVTIPYIYDIKTM